MSMAWIVLVPPLIVIFLAALTKRILFSLFVGIMSASLIITDGNIPAAASYILGRFWQTLQLERLISIEGFYSCSNLFLLAFLSLIGVLITIIRHSGAAYAYGKFVMNKIKTMRGAERASLSLSSLFFIDDYFASITVGSVMQPITDQFNIPRVKLALLVSAMAAPMAILMPMSTWVAELMGLLRNSGVGLGNAGSIIKSDQFSLYVMSVPFMMYAIIVALTIWYIVSARVSYGLVARHETYARKTGELFGGKIPVARRITDASEAHKRSSTLFDFLLPIVLLVASTMFLVLWTGSWWLLGGEYDFLTTLQHARMPFSFCCGGLTAVVGTVTYYMHRNRLAARALPGLLHEGFGLMSSSLVMLVFIWVLSGIVRDDLRTGAYLANLLVGQVKASFFPLMFFALAALISSLIGTAWGTVGILVPLALEMVPSFLGLQLPIDITQAPMITALIGAILSGSVVGNHVSPVSDVSVMSATSVGAYHLDVVRAQIQLALPTVIASLFAFYLVGLTLDEYGRMASATLGIIGGFLLNVMMLHALQWLDKRRKKR
ncbi:hypothetical protein EBZ39_10065 [bacterium]|nr:hypothetical protein [bacterium]